MGLGTGLSLTHRRVDITTVPPEAGLTDKEIAAVKKIWQGPRGTNGQFLWYGLEPGAPLFSPGLSLAGPAPFPVGLDHIRYWVEQRSGPGTGRRSITPHLQQIFRRSQELFNGVIGTDTPDLSSFKASGGKLLLWHGWSDELIFPRGTVDYYERVMQIMDGEASTTDFARLFLAPGVMHCNNPNGVAPTDTVNAFETLVQWVEARSCADPAADRTCRKWPGDAHAARVSLPTTRGLQRQREHRRCN